MDLKKFGLTCAHCNQCYLLGCSAGQLSIAKNNAVIVLDTINNLINVILFMTVKLVTELYLFNIDLDLISRSQQCQTVETEICFSLVYTDQINVKLYLVVNRMKRIIHDCWYLSQWK